MSCNIQETFEEVKYMHVQNIFQATYKRNIEKYAAHKIIIFIKKFFCGKL